MTAPALIRPPALRPGDIVRVVSPSGPTNPAHVSDAIALLESWGFRVQVGVHAFDQRGYLAGEDRHRLEDLNDALRDERVRAIWCARGGYGASRIVDDIDFAAAIHDPKLIIGYSDITALLQAMYVRSGITGLHAPVATSFRQPRDARVAQSLHSALTTDSPVVVRADPSEPTGAIQTENAIVEGRLLGGNLSLLSDALGTSSLPDYTGAIVFLEDVHEAPYRVDRMLTQLLRSGAWDGVAGFALGQFTNCTDTDWDVNTLDVLRERLGGLGTPMLGGFAVGHGDFSTTIPFGASARLDTTTASLTVQPAVRQPSSVIGTVV